MLSVLSLALLGLMLGIRHAVDPDHVVAVTTIATRETSMRRAASIGAMWGVGHTMTIMIVGGTIAGMILATVGIAWPASFAMTRAASSRRWLTLASGMLSLVFGLVLAVQLGVVDGLLLSDPRWTPR